MADGLMASSITKIEVRSKRYIGQRLGKKASFSKCPKAPLP
jgi:hypothetical protein